MEIEISLTHEGEGLPLPAYATNGSAGMDLYAAVPETLTLAPSERRLIPSGIRIAVPPGYEAQVRPRSGLALKAGISIVNSPGTIDSDYRGPVGVILINHGREPFQINRGDRIAQLLITPVMRVTWKPVERLEESQRGEGGFGHTGK